MDKVFLDEVKPSQKINVYTCPKGHKTVTVDLVDGTTPMFLNCRNITDGHACDQTSRSAWYMCDQTLTPEFEWYRPGPEEKLNKEERQHCIQGGLLIRRIGGPVATPPAPPSPSQTGRNEPCPCGSGKKFKKCCINNPLFQDVKTNP